MLMTLFGSKKELKAKINEIVDIFTICVIFPVIMVIPFVILYLFNFDIGRSAIMFFYDLFNYNVKYIEYFAICEALTYIYAGGVLLLHISYFLLWQRIVVNYLQKNK